MNDMRDPARLVARTIDQMDDVFNLILAADMACADVDDETGRDAIKSVLYAARKRLTSARDTIEAAREALKPEADQ